jgi:cell wall-associated NlpC family hydrolase
MKHAVCVVPVSPLRSEPSHRSEMVSQQVFGERCTVSDVAKGGWVKIKCLYDGYEGWCQQAHIEAIEEKDFSNGTSFVAEYVNNAEYNNQQMMLPFGSLVNLPTMKTNSFSYKGKTWEAKNAVNDELTIRALAFPFLNTGYLWGGKSVFGVDCSGFVQTVFKYLDVFLPRDAYQQAAEGEVVGFLQEAKCGDLAFFDNEEGRITHVGILLNDHQIIHSSSKVRIDKIDQHGIIQSETFERTHNLRIIKRYF